VGSHYTVGLQHAVFFMDPHPSEDTSIEPVTAPL
jgi:hypothetical protein